MAYFTDKLCCKANDKKQKLTSKYVLRARKVMGVFYLSVKRSTLGRPGLSSLKTSWFVAVIWSTLSPICLRAIFLMTSVSSSLSPL